MIAESLETRYVGRERNENWIKRRADVQVNNYIFDVDGTLIDTEKMYLLPLQKTLRANGKPIAYDGLKKVFGITATDALRMLGVKDVSAVQKQWFSQIKDYQNEAKVYPGIRETLAKLHANSHQHLAIATSKIKAEFQRDVVRFGLDRYFDAFVFSNEIVHGKPAPDLILKGIEKLAADPATTIYIGDTIYDLQAAHAAHVAFGLAGWRVQKTSEFANSDYYFAKPTDILAIGDLESSRSH